MRRYAPPQDAPAAMELNSADTQGGASPATIAAAELAAADMTVHQNSREDSTLTAHLPAGCVPRVHPTTPEAPP